MKALQSNAILYNLRNRNGYYIILPRNAQLCPSRCFFEESTLKKEHFVYINVTYVLFFNFNTSNGQTDNYDMCPYKNK